MVVLCRERGEKADDSLDCTDMIAVLAVIGDRKKQIKELRQKAALTVLYNEVTCVESMTINPRVVCVCTLVAGCAFVWQPAGWLETAEKTEQKEAQIALARPR